MPQTSRTRRAYSRLLTNSKHLLKCSAKPHSSCEIPLSSQCEAISPPKPQNTTPEPRASQHKASNTKTPMSSSLLQLTAMPPRAMHTMPVANRHDQLPVQSRSPLRPLTALSAESQSLETSRCSPQLDRCVRSLPWSGNGLSHGVSRSVERRSAKCEGRMSCNARVYSRV
jgi:hypothetical protein